MVICPHCGKENDDDVTFCVKCRQDLPFDDDDYVTDEEDLADDQADEAVDDDLTSPAADGAECGYCGGPVDEDATSCPHCGRRFGDAAADVAPPDAPSAAAAGRYEYSMVQMPQTIAVNWRHERGQEAAAYLQRVVNAKAADGWEFYRIDTVGVLTSVGCLASLLGIRATQIEYYVVTFRRERQCD